MIEIYQDSSEQWRWRAVSGNGQVVAGSQQGYKSEAGAIKGANATARVFYDAGGWQDLKIIRK